MKQFFLVFNFFAAVLFSDSHFIEFENVSIKDPFSGKYDFNIWCHAFGSAPELGIFFEKLKTDFQISTSVETGTAEGRTTKFFSCLFENVHTIEIHDATYVEALSNLQSFPNVTCHHGSSEMVLKNLLPQLGGEKILFYLDAHYYSYWPLLDELEEIGHTHKNNCVIVIDDIKVPARPGKPIIWGDSYNGQDCSLEYVADKLQKIFFEYDYFYLIPSRPGYSKAKLIVLPKSWGFKFDQI